mgnify:CR=1 FL=1
MIADGDPVAKPFDSVEKEFNEGRAAIYGGIFEQAIALIKRVVEVELNNAGTTIIGDLPTAKRAAAGKLHITVFRYLITLISMKRTVSIPNN